LICFFGIILISGFADAIAAFCIEVVRLFTASFILLMDIREIISLLNMFLKVAQFVLPGVRVFLQYGKTFKLIGELIIVRRPVSQARGSSI